MTYSLSVLPVGTKVRIAGEFEGFISAVLIGLGGLVQYRCVWWSSRSRSEEWLEALEVEPVEPDNQLRIGFAC